MRTRSGLVFGAAMVLSSLQLAADCVDGVTPDCSDAAARCGPSIDAATESSIVLPEASTDSGDFDALDAASSDADAATDG